MALYGGKPEGGLTNTKAARQPRQQQHLIAEGGPVLEARAEKKARSVGTDRTKLCFCYKGKGGGTLEGKGGRGEGGGEDEEDRGEEAGRDVP